MKEYVDCLKKYFCFSGRARRREYWMFLLFQFIFGLVAGVIDGVLGIAAFSVVYPLAMIIPGFAVFFRRLHDTGRSGWWWLIGLIPVIGVIVLFIFMCSDSQPGDNRFGPNPKRA